MKVFIACCLLLMGIGLASGYSHCKKVVEACEKGANSTAALELKKSYGAVNLSQICEHALEPCRHMLKVCEDAFSKCSTNDTAKMKAFIHSVFDGTIQLITDTYGPEAGVAEYIKQLNEMRNLSLQAPREFCKHTSAGCLFSSGVMSDTFNKRLCNETAQVCSQNSTAGNNSSTGGQDDMIENLLTTVFKIIEEKIEEYFKGEGVDEKVIKYVVDIAKQFIRQHVKNFKNGHQVCDFIRYECSKTGEKK